MRLLTLFILLLSSNLAQNLNAESMPEQCNTDCKTQYGLELGKSPAGIPAYSNCNSDCVIFEPNHLHDVYTGIKWQCVEYARRWLLHELGVVYGDVDIAADIWGLDTVSNPATEETYKFSAFVNGASDMPQIGDLLIYGKEYLGTGHVAVVVDVIEQKSVVRVVEQNYLNSKWENNFARNISYVNKSEQYWLLDAHLIGWKRVLIDSPDSKN